MFEARFCHGKAKKSEEKIKIKFKNPNVKNFTFATAQN
jgi:hypothetical protein